MRYTYCSKLTGLAVTGLCISAAAIDTALAAQITPNPNPVGNTLWVGESDSNSAVFDNFGSLVLSADVESRLTNDGTLNNYGWVSFDGEMAPKLIINNGTFNNAGRFSGGSFCVGLTDCAFVNNGTFNSTGDLDFLYGPAFVNTGTVNHAGVAFFQTADFITSGFFENSGRIDLYDGALIDNTGIWLNTGDLAGGDTGRLINQRDFINNGVTTLDAIENEGFLRGTGTYDITQFPPGEGFVLRAGAISPGGTPSGDIVSDTAGNLAFKGDFVMADGGTLDISIGGTTPGTFDVLNILEGTGAFQGGTIRFSRLNGFDLTSAVGVGETQTLTFLNAANGILDFSANLDFSGLQTPGFAFDTQQQDNALILRITRNSDTSASVPEPGLLLGLGALALIGTGRGVRHRRQ